MPEHYSVVLANATGATLPSYITVPPALAAARYFSILVEAEVTMEQFQTITGETDILPYLGLWLNHDEGPGHFNDYHALEMLEDLAEALNDHYPAPEGQRWQPRPQAEFANDPDRMHTLIHALANGLDSEWKINDLGVEACNSLLRDHAIGHYFVAVADA